MAEPHPDSRSGEETGPGDRPSSLKNGRFLLTVVTPERQVVDEEVEELRAPGLEGEFGVLPRHTRFMAVLGIGEVAYRRGKDWEHLAVASGFAEILPRQVTILAQTAELAHEIDLARARAAKERAERRLAKPDPETDVDRARAALQRAHARLRVAEGTEATR